MNDGNDSNNNRLLVEAVASGYGHAFFNTSFPVDLNKFSRPVVVTVNPGILTDVDFHRINPIPPNLMFVRVRTNTWNPEVLTLAVNYYTKRNVRVVVTFMAYYNETIPEGEKDFYTYQKRVTNSYWVLNRDMQEDILSVFKDNPLVYECGYKGTHACSSCGNCLREYYRVIEEMKNNGL